MPRMIIEGVVATTEPLRSRGVRLAPEALESIAAQFTPGMPIFREHGAKRIGEWHRLTVRVRPDGEFELYAEGEVDLPAGESAETYLGRGLSLGFSEVVSDLTGNEIATIGIESVLFADLGLEAAKEEFGEARGRVAVTWFHQFADMPPLTLAIHLLDNVGPVLQGATGAALWFFIQRGVVRLFARAADKAEFGTLRISGPHGVRVDAQVPTNPDRSPEVVAAIFDGVQKLIETETAVQSAPRKVRQRKPRGQR